MSAIVRSIGNGNAPARASFSNAPGEPDVPSDSAEPCGSTSHTATIGDCMSNDGVEIREFTEDDLEAVVAFSLRAWEPVFDSVRAVLGDDIFLRLHPDWRESQAQSVGSICMNDERDVFVAVIDGRRPIGFVAVALDAFHERMGAIEIIGVDPDHQMHGIGAQLTEFALAHMKARGMDIAVVETGGDSGHAPGRALYEATSFTLLPIARYFRLLD
jgi:ribosomal protein S18 acetylase RimI-like enzyme